MAKNKQKSKKQQNVFQVASKQSKPKPKPVKTSLKHINSLKRDKVENLNKIFSEVQRDMKSNSKSAVKKAAGKSAITREKRPELVNVDGAAQLFSQL